MRFRCFWSRWVYSIYDTDTGFRLFLFFHKDLDYEILDGFPVLLKERHRYQDFSGLTIGDSIAAVEKIDPVTELHKRVFFEKWKMTIEKVPYTTPEGYPCTTIHYLEDGIWEIEYALQEDGDLLITHMEYGADCKLENAEGRVFNCMLDDRDLPWHE